METANGLAPDFKVAQQFTSFRHLAFHSNELLCAILSRSFLNFASLK